MSGAISRPPVCAVNLASAGRRRSKVQVALQAQPGDALPVYRSPEVLKVGAGGSPVAFRGAFWAIFRI